MSVLVKVVCLADGGKTPHDGRYLRRWNPHSEFGTCVLDTTAHRAKAKRFEDAGEALAEWKTVSRLQTFRPDGNLNRPLTGLTIEIVKEDEAAGFRKSEFRDEGQEPRDRHSLPGVWKREDKE